MYHLIPRNGPHGGRRILVRAPVVTIGAGPDCEIRLSGAGVAARHAQLREVDGVVTISAIEARAPVRVNDRPEIARRLRAGDVIGIGDFEFEFVPPAGLDGLGVAREQRRPAPWLAYALISAFVAAQVFLIYQLNRLAQRSAAAIEEPSPVTPEPAEEGARPPEEPPEAPGTAGPADDVAP